MALWRLITRRMVAKVFLAIGIAVGAVLLVQARVESDRAAAAIERLSDREVRGLTRATRDSARRVAGSVIGAVKHSMLAGDGIEVRALLGELVTNLPDARVHVYDRRGVEVFAPKPPVPDPASLPPELARALASGDRQVAADGRIYRPVPHEQRCEGCHPPGRLRGVLEVAAIEYAGRRDELLPKLVTEGFEHIMTARQDDRLDTYFAELTGAGTSIRGIAVYDREGDVAFGRAIEGIAPGEVTASLAPGSRQRTLRAAGASVSLIPLAMTARCVACHESDAIGTTRGVLAVALAAELERLPGLERLPELERLIDTSLRYIMLSKLGRRIGDFLDAVVEVGAARSLALYDQDGRRFWTTDHPAPPAHLGRALAGDGAHYELMGEGMDERALVVEPLANGEACVRCHGADVPLLGAVTVSLSTAVAAHARAQATAAAARARADNMRSKLTFTGLTLAGILVILASLLQYLVARPVRQIGDVADAVGAGDLSASVVRASDEGDEIARLGARINQMVAGLRAKTNLEKFVSRGAALAAEGAGVRGVARTGERRAVAVLFSDIRGFTSFSEDAAPEVVVEMLNRLLRAQAETVVAHGGDIDKFVGDELMAVFHGADAARSAVACAVQMIAAVHEAREAGETLSVGVGIAAGEVVYGAIGHEDRMDFTVIGDVVNTGARLCSAASPDEILIAAPARAACGEIDGVAFEAGEPLALKGKAEPLPVYRVTAA